MLKELLRQKKARLGLAAVGVLLLICLLAPLLAPNDPYKVNILRKLAAPCAEFPLGTDQLGRCVLSRLIWGARLTLSSAVTATALMLLIGVPLGIAAGLCGGWVDSLIMRVTDVASSLSPSLLALAVVGLWGPSLANIVAVFAALWWAMFARVVRGAALEVMQRDYVTAAVAAGCGRLIIAVRHVLPNVLSPVVVLAALRIGTVVTHLASFSFLGLGAQPPAADWGVMLSDCRPYLSTRPLMILWPGAAIMSSVLAFHLFGEGLNAALHPRREGGTSDD